MRQEYLDLEYKGRVGMGSQLLMPNSELAILARLLETQPDELMRDAAQYLLRFGFTEQGRRRIRSRRQVASRSFEQS